MKLSKEEKKAIDDLFALTHINGYIDLYTQKEAKIHTLDLSRWQNGVKVLLNLIDNQQKEIDRLNRKQADDEMLKGTFIERDYISRNKIREKIKELDTLYNYNLDTAMTSYEMFVFVRSYIDKVKNILEELLEEK